MKRIFAFFILLLLVMPCIAPAQTLYINPSNTSIQFKVRNMGFTSVKGFFEKFKGTVVMNENEIVRANVDVTIDTSTINTGISMRDDHLRGPDFFDVIKFPVMTFVSTAIEAVDDKIALTGNLTMKGVTKQVTLIVEGKKSSQGDYIRGATATTSVNRQDFGINWGAVIADEVFITIGTELLKP